MNNKIDNPDYKKMIDFIDKLLYSKNFENQSIINREDSVVKFFAKNEELLKPNFLSPDYYPNMNWEQIKVLFFTALRDRIVFALSSEIDNLAEYINFTVVRVVADGPLEDFKTKILNLYKNIIIYKEVRNEFDSVSNAIKLGYIKRYLEAFKLRAGYGSKELFKYKQLQDLDDYSHFLKICALLRNITKARLPIKDTKGKIINVNYDIVLQNPVLKREYLKSLNEFNKKNFSMLPELFVKTSINSAIDFSEYTKDIEASSMFLKIILERCKNVVWDQKVDKAAETPDKSWFSIAKRNIGYNGFDPKLLDEFYIIASELNL